MSRFRQVSRRKLADAGLADKLHAATETSLSKYAAIVAEMTDWPRLRDQARQIKLHTLAHLNRYLDQFAEAARSNGAVVVRTDTAEQACKYVVGIARRRGVTRVTKAKSMVGEEIEINRALQQAGIEPIETDLGEMICQLAGDQPSHVTAPIIHWSMEEVARLLKYKGVIQEIPEALARRSVPHTTAPNPASPDPKGPDLGWGLHPPPRNAPPADLRTARLAAAATLVAAARKNLREKFFSAGMGLSGANFAVAESGSIVLLENEGNIRLSTTLPRVHIAVVGIEKLIPRLADLSVFLSLLPVAATGQRQSGYVSIINRPFDELHIVLLDNGRSRLLGDEQHRDLLSCIRCGACMNVCPVYRHVSGHGYGAVYPGPIGCVLMPHLRPNATASKELPFASSLCSACAEICPVRIPLDQRLLEWRDRLVAAGDRPRLEGLAFAAWAWLMCHPRVYRLARPPASWLRMLSHLPIPLRNWNLTRDLPPIATETFTDWWEKNCSAAGPADPLTRKSDEARRLSPPGPSLSQSLDSSLSAPPSNSGISSPDLAEIFTKRLNSLRAPGDAEPAVLEVADAAEAARLVADLRCDVPSEDIAWFGDPDRPPPRRDLALGLTPASALIAATGSVIMELPDARDGYPSLLVDRHIVVAARDQLVADLSAFYDRLSERLAAGESLPNLVCITGCSRTADIEKLLVVPAHGPRQIRVILSLAPISWPLFQEAYQSVSSHNRWANHH